MKINILLFFLVRTVSLLGQEQYLTTLEKMGFNSKKQFEYNFVHTEKGAFFVSDKTQVSAVQVTDGKDNNLSCIYYVTCRKNKYGPPKKVDINFSNHIGSFTVNEKENFIVFTGRQAKTAVTFGLFQTEKIKGKWSEPTLVIKDMEQSNFTDPFLTKSGDTLLFASDLPGGNGGLDLYYGIGVKGNWSRVEKISENVNTIENERFPFLHNNILYFSSNRADGMGGMDVYSNEFIEGKYSKSLLLDSSINSVADDFSVAFYQDKMFFTSNRDGSDDIFKLVTNIPEFECIPEIPLVRCYEFSEENAKINDTIEYVYKWSMGDGTEYLGLIADHCFKDSGTYIIELDIYDAVTNEIIANQASYELTLEDPDQLEIILPENIKSGVPLEFKVNGQNHGDSSKLYWNFGDGKFTMGRNVIHNYFQGGTYEISVGLIFFKGGEEIRICTSKLFRIL
jgi:hypothetical protein